MVDQIKYEKIETKPKSPFRVVEVDVQAVASIMESTRSDKHWHRSIEFVIPVENTTEMWVEGEIFHVCPEAMVLVNSRYIHECCSVNPLLPYKGYAIQLKYDFLKEILPDIDNYQFDVFYDIESHPYLFNLIRKVIKMDKSDSQYKYIRLLGLAYDLCYELASHYSVAIENNKIYQPSKNKGRLVEILSYLDKHINEPFDAQVVADEFHLSYGHLAKLFKSELGMTMKEYVNSVRVRNASFDLLASDAPVFDIAMQHGFVSSKSFYKEFEKVYHMTPKQYRKNASK